MAASSPQNLELRFQKIQEITDAPVSARWALCQVAQFLTQLDLERPSVESYLLPLAEPIATRADELNPVGLHPDTIADLAGQLQNARRHHPALTKIGQLGEAERALRRRAALLYAYAGAMDRAVNCLALEAEEEPAVENLTASAPRERFDEVRTRTSRSDLDRAFQWIAAQWDQEESRRHVSSVPVVEQSPAWMKGGAWEGGEVGALQQVGVELYGPSDTTDRLQVDVVAHGADEADLAAVPLRAARRLLEDRHPRLQGRYVQGRLAFDYSHLRHQGQSAGLAVAALFYGAMLDYTHRRCRRRIHPQVAISGSISADGTVRPIDEDTLPVKVRTVFFSPKTVLVVPEGQRDTAAEVQASLLDDYPHGELAVVGVDRLEALFFDRRLTEEEHVGWVRHLGRQVWNRRGRVVTGTVITALLLVIAALLYGPIDKNPTAVDFAGETMVLKNESGQVVERISVGEETVTSAHHSNYNAYRLGDIDQNGRNEICWARWNSPQRGDTPRLQCKGIGEDSLRWTLETRFDVTFPRKPAVSTKGFKADYIRIGDFDANGRTEMIVTLQHDKYFPYLVLKLDADSGRKLGQYLHVGYLYSEPLPTDLNKDGVTEILLAGMNNAYNQAVFTVLDPRYIGGHGPTRGDYVVKGGAPAREVAYLRIPRTIVDRAQPRTVNKGSSLVSYDRKDRILIEVWDGRHPGSEKRRSRILLQLDSHFRPVAIGTSNQYDRLANHLKEEGRIENVPDYDYFQQYKQQFRYWTGSDWSREPTVNARWRAATETAWRPDSAKAGEGAATE